MNNEQLTQALVKAIISSDAETLQEVSEFLISSGLVQVTRLRQFLAVRDFYSRYQSIKKCELIMELAALYNVSERTLKSLTTDKRRFRL